MTAGRRIAILFGLLIALALPFGHLSDLGKSYSGLGSLWGNEVLWWALLIIIVAYTLVIERKPLSSLGFHAPAAMDVVLAVGFALVAMFGIGVIFDAVLPVLHLTVTQRLSVIYQAPFWFRVLLVTRAAIVEETAFRGYGFERITELTSNKSVAALLTFVLFTAAHYAGGGLGQVIIAAWGGLVLTVLYLWRRNLWANILCHWLTDGAGFLLMPMVGHR